MTDPFAPQEPYRQPPPVGGSNPPPHPDGSTPWSSGSAPYAAPTSTPYPPAPGTPYGVQPDPWSGQAPSPRGTDGVSIAALVTGLLQTGPIAVVLGIIGLRRVNRSGRDGKGMAITGIVLGAITTVIGTVFAALAIGGVIHWVDSLDHSYGDDPGLDMLWDACASGDMGACDDLYMESGFGTEYEEFGDTCGGRTDGSSYCRLLDDVDREDPVDDGAAADGDGDTYGDNPELDVLWDACEAGDMGACDDLFMESDFGSEYEEFGDTCGGRTDGGTYCRDLDD